MVSKSLYCICFGALLSLLRLPVKLTDETNVKVIEVAYDVLAMVVQSGKV